MSFEKKNYTIKFFEDAGESKKHKLSFNGWAPTNKYCLKANYIDYSMCRNVVSSNIWSEVVQSREVLDKIIAELEFYGGIDGYPVALFINDEYKGVYTFNIAKDEDTYKISDEENEAMFVINSAYSDAANFKALITEGDKKSVFDLEYSYPEHSVWAYDSMNNLIQFVMDNDGVAFVNGIDQYLDVDAAIDYLITAYVLGVTDNFAKNMILLTYDGQQWIPNMYDLDTACGLIFDGTGYMNYDFCLPTINNDGGISSGTENLLWDRLLNNCSDRFMGRYFELRKNILSTNSLERKYLDFIDSIPLECYEEELELYPEIPYAYITQKDQITTFLNLRCDL